MNASVVKARRLRGVLFSLAPLEFSSLLRPTSRCRCKHLAQSAWCTAPNRKFASCSDLRIFHFMRFAYRSPPSESSTVARACAGHSLTLRFMKDLLVLFPLQPSFPLGFRFELRSAWAEKLHTAPVYL